MKQLLLIRHAKTNDPFMFKRDFDRTLTERGIKDADAIANFLLEEKIKIDAFISSTAVRALSTASIMANAYNKNVIEIDELYHAGPPVFKRHIREIDDSIKCAAIFAHNEGITIFANMLCDNARIDNMPTASVFAVKADIESWKEFAEYENEFWFFKKPKEL